MRKRKPTVKLPEKNRHPGGRPTKYTKELAEKICKVIATSTDGLKAMCQKYPEFPCVDTIFEWRFVHKEFSELYAEAKRYQADLMVEQISEISDRPKTDMLDFQNARLQVDTRKWIACKLIPKVYGDKTQNDTTVTLTHEKALEQLK